MRPTKMRGCNMIAAMVVAAMLTTTIIMTTTTTIAVGAHQQHQQQHQHQHHQSFVLDNNNNNQMGQLPAMTQEMPTSSQPQPPPLDQQQQQQPQQQQQQQQQSQQPQPRSNEGSMFRYELLDGGTSVRLKWNLRLNQQQHVDYFDLLYGPIPDNAQMFNVSQLDKSRRDYTVHNLEPDTKYQFELRSYQAGRPAQRPELLLVQTPPANQVASMKVANALAAEIMPLGVKAEAKSATSIQLSWNEPERPAQIRNSLRYNIIRYYAAPANSSEQPRYHYLNVSQPPESRVLISKLKPATEYAFAVRTLYYTPDMRKLFLQSGFSMDTLGRTHDLEPTAPRNFTIKPHHQLGELHFSWLPPEQPNGQLRGYLILHSPDPQAPDHLWSRIEVQDPQLNSWVVKNEGPQEAGRRFFFKIRALNQRGQSPDSDTKLYVVPANNVVVAAAGVVPPTPANNNQQPPIPANNLLMLVVICMVAIFFLLSLIVSRLVCRTGRRKPRKGSFNNQKNHQQQQQPPSQQQQQQYMGKADLTNGNSSTVAARVGTLARRRDNNKPDFWISAMDQKPSSDTSQLIPPAAGAALIKPSLSDKSISDLNMAMVSIQRDSPQFATTQLAPALPDYRFASQADQLLQMVPQQQSHYHPGLGGPNQFQPLGYDQMDNATASALMTLSKRQQQQLQKYQIQFAATGVPPNSGSGGHGAPSPHQQPPPPPPLNIEQQQQQQQQSIYGTHQPLGLQSTRSLRLHRPTLYDPVSGSFVQAGAQQDPPNYNSHLAPMLGAGNHQLNSNTFNNTSTALNTFQFQPHQTSTLMSRRSTNTLRSFQTSTANYGQLGGTLGSGNNNSTTTTTTFAQAPMGQQQQQQPQQILQSHQAVINQLNQSTYPSLPLKHVSAVRPQIMSSLEDQIEMELAEKEQQEQQQASATKQ